MKASVRKQVKALEEEGKRYDLYKYAKSYNICLLYTSDAADD